MHTKKLEALLGRWTTEATHPAMPGLVVKGTANVEWLEGEKFLIYRSTTDHDDFPDGISIIGLMDRGRAEEKSAGQLMMSYFDSRGVHRELEVSVDEKAWRMIRHDPGFSQRFTGTFRGGDVIEGLWELSEDADEETWRDDLKITFRRVR